MGEVDVMTICQSFGRKRLNMARDAYIVGVGETRHAPRRDDVNTTELAWEAVSAALEDAGVALADVGGAITASQDFWEGRTISSMAVNEVAGATFKAESKVAADGLLALVYASARIATGLESLLLVLAHCKESQADVHAVERAAFDPYLQRDLDPDETVAAALQARLLDYPLELRARVVEASRRHSRWLEPLAASDVAASPETASPLRRLERAPQMDGACALVVCDEATASRLGRPCVRLAGAATSTGRYWIDGELTAAPALRAAVAGALRQSGWDGAPERIELSATFAHQVLLFGSELGLGGPAEVTAAVEQGTLAPTGGSLAGRPGIVSGLSAAIACARHLREAGGRAVAHGTTGILAQSHHVACLEAA
jgi:acetyl-CoA C-acetyltransferase